MPEKLPFIPIERSDKKGKEFYGLRRGNWRVSIREIILEQDAIRRGRLPDSIIPHKLDLIIALTAFVVLLLGVILGSVLLFRYASSIT